MYCEYRRICAEFVRAMWEATLIYCFFFMKLKVWYNAITIADIVKKTEENHVVEMILGGIQKLCYGMGDEDVD